jgi:hypothetical protein
MKTYTLSRALRYLTIPGAAILFTWSLFPPYYGTNFRRGMLVLGCIYVWYRILLTPYKVKIHDDDLIEFISIIKTVKIYPKDIESIEEPDTTPAIKVHHTKGTTKISSLFDNLTGLKGTLKSFCPKKTNEQETEQNENMDKVDSINTFLDH